MNRSRINWIAVFVLAVAMAFPLSFALNAQRRRYPNLRGAMASLESARSYLNHASRNFGGHRAAALQATENALRECHEAIRYASHR